MEKEKLIKKKNVVSNFICYQQTSQANLRPASSHETLKDRENGDMEYIYLIRIFNEIVRRNFYIYGDSEIGNLYLTGRFSMESLYLTRR